MSLARRPSVAGALSGPGVLLGYGGDGMDGTAGEYWTSGAVTNLNTAAVSVTMIAYVRSDYGVTTRFASVWGTSGSGGNACTLAMTSTGEVMVRVRQSDATDRNATATAPVGWATGGSGWIAHKVNVAARTASFYTSVNDSAHHPGYDVTAGDWTLLGTADRTITSWDGTFQSKTTAILSMDTANAWDGLIFYASGAIDGTTPAWEVDFRQHTNLATSIVDQRGITWTATGTGVNVVRL